MAHGVTPEGFNRKTLEEILSEIEAEERAGISPGLNVSPSSPIGQLNGIFATKLSELWELAQAVYGDFDPASASAAALDHLASITGTKRRDPEFSLARCILDLDVGTYPAGQLVASVSGNPEARFRNRDEIVASGHFDGGFFIAEQPGPVQAPANSLSVIAEPVPGWNNVSNIEDADPGRFEESDVALRARRQVEVAGGGADSAAAIRAHVSRVRGVNAVNVIENWTDVVRAGVPPKAFEAVVFDGGRAIDNEVAQAIWESKPVGIQPFGAIAATATDSEGRSQQVHFSRVEQLNVWLELTLFTDPATYQNNNVGVAQAILEYANQRIGIGRDVVLSELCVPIFSVPGVLDIAEVLAGTSSLVRRPENIVVNARQIAVFDSSRIFFDD